MRSGSTLLKALMSAAPDISSLPETNFQKFQSDNAEEEVSSLSEERIIVLKRPAWFNEIDSYPRLPNVADHKRVILARDVHTTTASLRKMASEKRNRLCQNRQTTGWPTATGPKSTLNLLQRFPDDGISNFWIRYEDLVSGPIEWTGKLFRFLGSERSEGTDSYPPPSGYDWKWGTDDGGEKIKSLKVRPLASLKAALIF